MKTLVLLDFDGTVYRGDSMLDFARFLNPKKYRRSLLLLLWMVPFSWINPGYRDRLKARFLELNFGGIEHTVLQEKGRAFYALHKDKCYPKALEWIASLDRETHEVFIVSASCHEWLEPFVEAWNTGLICTRLEFQQTRCTGAWSGANLRGAEKVKAVQEILDLSQYSEIIAFGNERSDLAFEEIAERVEINYFR